MYEKLIKSLRNCVADENGCCFQCPEDCNGPCQENLMKQAADAIEELQDTVQAQDKALKCCADQLARRWTSVTERLPKKEKKKYWVCTDTGYQCECRWTDNPFGIEKIDEWRWSIFDVPQYQKVMAWMDLPEPYKPPKEET